VAKTEPVPEQENRVNTPRLLALVALVLLPAIGWSQQAPASALGGMEVSQYRPIAPLTPEPTIQRVTCDGFVKTEMPPDVPAGPYEESEPRRSYACWPQIWGYMGLDVYPAGNHMAPNGVPFRPLAALDWEINLSLLPDKELYLFADNKFWTQKAGAGVTNPSQGQFDFSKREYDLTLGAAWTYFDAFEFRLSTYGLNNLNRGNSLASPFGFKDGVLLENRFYLGNADIYDVGRLSFLSIGYYPSKSMVGGDGSEFHPGLFARAYLTYDVPAIRSYVYFDGTYTAERVVKSRLLEMDLGIAARPFERLPNLEFRLGYDVTGDVQADTSRNLLYGAIRIKF
jgi:hypothetical protein